MVRGMSEISHLDEQRGFGCQTYEVHRIGFTRVVLGNGVSVARPKMCSMSRWTGDSVQYRANVIGIIYLKI